MKVELSYEEARAYYRKKELEVRHTDDRYVLSRRLDGKYGTLRSAFPDQKPLSLVVLKEVDYLAGGSFVDPLRTLPTCFCAGGGQISLFSSDELNAAEGWATIGRFWPDGASYVNSLSVAERAIVEQAWLDGEMGGLRNRGPIFVPTAKMGKAQQMLVFSKWDRRTMLKHVGLEDEANLRSMLLWKFAKRSGNGLVLYFDSLSDAQGLSGINCFVIPLVKGDAEVEKWLEAYRHQKRELIKYSEAEYRIFKRTKDAYARKILDVLPEKACWPKNVGRVWRNRDGIKDEIVVEYVTGMCDRYRCDSVGYEEVRQDYGK